MDISNALTWAGIALCVMQSGSFSGLNLSLFGVSALRLEALEAAGNEDAKKLLELRRDSNFILTTVLWGNVGTNVLLTLLTDSVLAGAFGFVFSTFVITLGGEIAPQAYFSRNALRMATVMRPFLRFWQTALYPIAKPTALVLDAWLGRESIDFLQEHELREVLKRYVASPTSEISRVEGTGALNFMALDDLSVLQEGEDLDPRSVIELDEEAGRPIFPAFDTSPTDPFLRKVEASEKKWVVVVNADQEPRLVLDADAFIRAALFGESMRSVEQFCHRPIVVRDPETKLGGLLPRMRIGQKGDREDVIDRDVILLWGQRRRIITGADLFGRLLLGIAKPSP